MCTYFMGKFTFYGMDLGLGKQRPILHIYPVKLLTFIAINDNLSLSNFQRMQPGNYPHRLGNKNK